ncbi:MAG: hypothetical protein RI907_3284 [Pseudomonadota bacterium]|jgi:diguanylate cyclase (GGDEF)-like protein
MPAQPTTPTEASQPHGAAFDGLLPAPGSRDEVIYRNERTLIARRHLSGGATVVIKQAFGAEAQARLRHEARVLQRLSGVEGVVRLHPQQPAEGVAFVDVDSVSLAQVLLEGRPGVQALLGIGLALSHVLAAVHRLGVIHKDINPSNVLLVGAERHPQLIDFNISTCFAEERPGFVHQSDIAGTLAYMSPEQTGRTGRAVDPRSDLYALGVTLYEMATGHKPFETDDLLEMIHDHLLREPTPPVALVPELPPALSDIILRLLQKEADSRYQSAEGLARDLQRLRARLGEGLTETFALGVDDYPARLMPPAQLVGRRAEVATLQTVIDQAALGRGRALLVAGAPGVGKSALINELQPMVTARRGWFVQGKFEQYQRDATSAFLQALRGLGRLLLAEPEQELARIRQRILQSQGANLGLGPSLLPEFAVLLGHPAPIQVDDPVEAERRMIEACLDLLRAVVSPDQPLVMVVDDLQWAPAVSLRFMDALVTRDKELHGLLVIGAYRDSEVDAAHPLFSMMQRWSSLHVMPPVLQLGNLPPQDVGQLIEAMLRLPEREASHLARALVARTDGNPYDTVELINALRQDGLLQPVEGGWRWDEGEIQRYVGDCDVVGLLGRRIERMPPQTRQLMSTLACLGGEGAMPLLMAATGLDAGMLEQRLAPALEDGLLVAHQAHEREIRFRHDRVQQAVHERTAAIDNDDTSLALARQLVKLPGFQGLAAKLYLRVAHHLQDPAECRLARDLLREGAQASRVVNYELTERFLQAAIAMSARLQAQAGDEACLRALQSEHHAALYGLGRLDDADAVYAQLAATATDPHSLVDPAAVQMASLSIRGRHRDALDLGLAMLAQLGFQSPADIKTAIGMALFKMAGWIAGNEKEADLDRPEVTDPHVLAIAKMLSKSQVAAFFCSTKTGAWLTMESFELWVQHGPCPSLMATLCSTPMQIIAIGEDFQGAHTLGQHLIRVGEKRGYEPATSVARFLFAFCCSHWFAPLEHSLPIFRKAREGLFQGGELQYGVFTYASWLPQFDASPSIAMCLDEIDGADAVCQRTGDTHFTHLHRPSIQLIKALQGQIPDTQPPGSLHDDSFDEAAYEATVQEATTATAFYQVTRSLSAAIFNDPAGLHAHSALAMGALGRVPGNYLWARIHPLRAMSLGIQLREARAQAEPDTAAIAALQAELDKCIKWMGRRAKDAPMNFRHVHTWMQAERAWALGQHWEALSAFNQAMDEAGQVVRPWQTALITERAARFHLSQGLDRSGQPLMQTARDRYQAWGASGKVSRLDAEHDYLQARGAGTHGSTGRSTVVSTDMVDVLSVLRASQAISSETSLAALSQRVGKVLGAMTGAATVNLLVRPDERSGWQMQVFDTDGQAHTEALELAVERGRLPESVFRYAERTREALLLPEATRDERFARDPYFKGQAQCSLLMLPILSKGDLRACVMLENRLSRGAFSAERLDAVSMIAGQLAVSLDNALLYASLEQKVAERTAELEEANHRLELLSTTDALTGVANRRKFNEALDAEWLRARRTRQPIGLVLIDIDHFKLYNDHYGHQGGDACLQMVASTMKHGLRAGSDLIARYGGEEFVLLLPNTDLAGTMVVAERVRAAVEARHEPHAQAASGFVSVSLGVTSFVPGGDTRATQHVAHADQALYEAKRGGRNRVVASSH